MDEPRELSLRTVLHDRMLCNVHFVRRASIFGRGNNFTISSRSNLGLYSCWADFSTVYALEQS